MILKVDTSINEKTVNILKESKEIIDSSVKDTLKSDFSPLTQLGIFSSQIESLQKAIDNLSTFHENFISVVEENTYQWGELASSVQSDLNGLGDGTGSGGGYTGGGSGGYSGGGSGGYSGGGSGGYSGGGSGSNDLGAINKGKSVKTDTVSSLIDKLDSNTLPILLKKLYLLNGKKSIIDLLVDEAKSGVLLAYLKKILGDTTDLDETSTEESEKIQKQILEKVNTENVDLDTEEGKSELEKVVLENINNAPADESEFNQILYGDNTTQLTALDGEWIVAKTNIDILSYEQSIISNGVRQNANAAWGDSCLAFAGAHTYDLEYGTYTSGPDAANYAHASSYEDFINDDKNVVLAKIYDEIMNGRPVVLQVNGNKAGTSRHFVTVVGFKAGITSADQLTEDDLLIIDSWDGKLERMDTASSRFMTSGKDCNKDYSGYRLRVFKQTTA